MAREVREDRKAFKVSEVSDVRGQRGRVRRLAACSLVECGSVAGSCVPTVLVVTCPVTSTHTHVRPSQSSEPNKYSNMKKSKAKEKLC